LVSSKIPGQELMGSTHTFRAYPPNTIRDSYYFSEGEFVSVKDTPDRF